MTQPSLYHSIKSACSGLLFTYKNERNMKIHIVIALLTITLGFLMHLTKTEWICILLTIGLVLVLEMINTAIEKALDLLVPTYNPAVKQVKDIAAGAVLISSILASIIGIIIFGSKILNIGVQ